VLLSMVFVASFSAGVRNLTRFDIKWANELLMDMEWADSFLRKGTMWLAFLGASLATHYRKHISIDLLTRLAPLKAKYTMHMLAGLIGGAITIALAFSFASAVKLNLTERPIEYEILGDSGSMHICDATDEQLKALEDTTRPTGFCIARKILGALSVPAETPGAAFQIIVPIMFLLMGLRFIFQGIEAGGVMIKGIGAMEEAEAEDRARLAAVHAAVSKAPPPHDAGDAGGHS
jgi:TRAP-type C4-dicarboxylate transport system permease small subunit